ncbi:MAG: RNA-binding cell elongation regulator Jag/EloR [Armatimonadota bacterium]
MDSIEQIGRNVEDAVAAALKALKASRDEVEVEVLSEESRGILGSILGYSSAKVRVTRKAPQAPPAEPEPAPAERPRQPERERRRAEPRPTAPPTVEVGERSELAERAAAIADDIVRLMGLEAKTIVVEDSPEGVSLEVHSDDDLGLLIGKHGQTLSALQLIVAMMANRPMAPDDRRRIVIDAEGYRARRERALQSMARSAAQRAKRSGRPVTISSLNARERRVIHITLADDPAVTTRSEGEEPDRSIIITARSGERDRGRRGRY